MGVYAALDDVEKCEALARHPFVAAQVNVALGEVRDFLESVPWVAEGHAYMDSSPGVDGGEAATPGEVQA